MSDIASYNIDYLNAHSVVWAFNCTQNIMNATESSPCTSAPTYVQTSYNTTAPSPVWVESYTMRSFSGYKTSGQIYYDTICNNDNYCKYMKIYAADVIHEDIWNYDNPGSFGILGYGSNSPFWMQYVDSAGQASYSMLLAAPTTNNAALGAGADSTSAVSFGSTGTEYSSYTGQLSVEVMANIHTYEPTYDLEDFGFGLVYTNDNT